MNDTASRFLSWTALEVGTHLVQFPLEVLGCTLPWSLLLLGWASRDLRRSLGDARPQSLFMAISVGIAFLSIWIPPDGQTRYFTPLYPCMAVLIGLVVEGCIRADAPSLGRDAWRRFSLFQAGVMVTLGLVVVFAACCLPNHPKYAPWAEPVFVAIGYAAASVVLAVVTLRGRHGGDAVRIRNTVLAIACFMVLTFTGVVTDIRVRRSEDQASAVARLKEQLPPGQRLVSFGGIDQLFAYYYAVPIDRLPLPGKGPGLDSEHDFFCFQSFSGSRPTLPFAWREVAAISMDRHASATPESMVVVGRRVPAAIAAAPSPAERSKPGR